jgi:hypothetical protein
MRTHAGATVNRSRKGRSLEYLSAGLIGSYGVPPCKAAPERVQKACAAILRPNAFKTFEAAVVPMSCRGVRGRLRRARERGHGARSG